MPFSPNIRDQRAEFAYEGKAALGAGIASGISSVGTALLESQQQAAALKEENEGLMAAWEMLGPQDPEMQAKWEKGGLSARKQILAGAMSAQALEEKRAMAAESAAARTAAAKEATDYASQNRLLEEQRERERQEAEARAMLDFSRQEALRTGRINDGDNERIRSAPTAAAGQALLDSLLQTTGALPPTQPSYRAMPVEGAGTIVIDETTGKPVSASQVIRPPRPAAGGAAPLVPGMPTGAAPAIDPAQAAQGLPTVQSPTAPRPQQDSAGTVLPVDWFFGR